MKTQLLEDIGENATLPLAPAGLAANPTAGKAVPRQEPAGAPPISTTQQPEQQPAPLELHSVFEEIAALEAQLVPPGQQHESGTGTGTGIAPAEPRHEVSTSPAEPLPQPATVPAELMPEPAVPATGPLHKLAVPPAARLLRPAAPPAEPLQAPVIPPAVPLQAPVIPPTGPTLVPDPMQSPTVPRDPLFDFTVPAPAYQAADPFTRPPSGLTRSRQRFLLWGACVLAGALLILGGRWLYQERNDAGALALIADEAKTAPQADKAVTRGAIAAGESTQGPEGDVGMAPAAVPAAAPAVPAVRPSPALPPLVMLEPDPPAATGREPPPPLAPTRAEPRTPPKPEPVAEQAPASPSPKPSSRRARAQSDAAAEPARERGKRAPVRQPVRAPAMATERPSGQDTTMTATLKACREHGYGPAQCVKRGCSLTRYGFACRGR